MQTLDFGSVSADLSVGLVAVVLGLLVFDKAKGHCDCDWLVAVGVVFF